jgi:hypothetical protein
MDHKEREFLRLQEASNSLLKLEARTAFGFKLQPTSKGNFEASTHCQK